MYVNDCHLSLLMLCFILGVCGQSNFQTKRHRERRVIGGHIEKERWPWLVQIKTTFYSGNFKTTIVKCAGTIVRDNWIITAAHCVDFPASKRKLYINAGSTKIKANDVHVHPKYKGGMYNDIALIKYDADINSHKEVVPICLPEMDQGANFTESSHCFISGWGKTNSNNIEGLRHTAPVVYYGVCTRSSSIICAGDPQRLSGACDGDSGGPLMCSGNNEEYYLAGVLSHGPKQCGSDLDVYINPKRFVDWFKDIMNENNVR